jgi:DNA-directed RNA polymerase specialized sigma24 family protein
LTASVNAERVTQLFEDHHASLFRYLTRLSGDADLAADATRTRRARLLEGAPGRAPVGDPPLDAQARLEVEERRRVVSAALLALSGKERTALLMQQEGFSHREIADTVGTTTGSVGTLLARALEKLASALPLDSNHL